MGWAPPGTGWGFCAAFASSKIDTFCCDTLLPVAVCEMPPKSNKSLRPEQVRPSVRLVCIWSAPVQQGLAILGVQKPSTNTIPQAAEPKHPQRCLSKSPLRCQCPMPGKAAAGLPSPRMLRDPQGWAQPTVTNLRRNQVSSALPLTELLCSEGENIPSVWKNMKPE